MVLILLVLPVLVLVVSGLALGNAGRSFRERVTIFLVSPADIDNDNILLLRIVRSIFWSALAVSLWMLKYIMDRN